MDKIHTGKSILSANLKSQRTQAPSASFRHKVQFKKFKLPDKTHSRAHAQTFTQLLLSREWGMESSSLFVAWTTCGNIKDAGRTTSEHAHTHTQRTCTVDPMNGKKLHRVTDADYKAAKRQKKRKKEKLWNIQKLMQTTHGYHWLNAAICV